MTRLLPRRNQHDKSQRLYKIINMIMIEYGLYVIFVSLMCTSEMLVCVYIFRLIACVSALTLTPLVLTQMWHLQTYTVYPRLKLRNQPLKVYCVQIVLDDLH